MRARSISLIYIVRVDTSQIVNYLSFNFMLVPVFIKSLDGFCNLAVYVPYQKRVTKMLESAYTKLASVADLSFCFWQAIYIVRGHSYYIDSNLRARRTSLKH